MGKIINKKIVAHAQNLWSPITQLTIETINFISKKVAKQTNEYNCIVVDTHSDKIKLNEKSIKAINAKFVKFFLKINSRMFLDDFPLLWFLWDKDNDVYDNEEIYKDALLYPVDKEFYNTIENYLSEIKCSELTPEVCCSLLTLQNYLSPIQPGTKQPIPLKESEKHDDEQMARRRFILTVIDKLQGYENRSHESLSKFYELMDKVTRDEDNFNITQIKFNYGRGELGNLNLRCNDDVGDLIKEMFIYWKKRRKLPLKEQDENGRENIVIKLTPKEVDENINRLFKYIPAHRMYNYFKYAGKFDNKITGNKRASTDSEVLHLIGRLYTTINILPQRAEILEIEDGKPGSEETRIKDYYQRNVRNYPNRSGIPDAEIGDMAILTE